MSGNERFTLVENGLLGEFPYAIIYNKAIGHNCGYLGVPASHPWYGKHSDDIDCDVHGGLTYSESSYYGHNAEINRLVAKIAEELALPDSLFRLPRDDNGKTWYERNLDNEMVNKGQPRNYPIETNLDIWWLGFDCGHHMDARSPQFEIDNPQLAALMKEFPEYGTYKDRDYVYHELEGLAAQAAEAYQKGGDNSENEDDA